jgi:dTDP-4-dehydrorhamnose 3,5-epimerase
MAKVEILDKVSLFTNDSFQDNRGQLFTIWKQPTLELNFNHDKAAISKRNVLRGLHTDKSWKLISCLYGKMQLVVVNFDITSNQYLDHMSLVLDYKDHNKTSVLIPPGFLNGHLILSDEAVFHYKWSYDGDYPDVSEQTSVNWADPKIGIKWLIDNPILSTRDKSSKLL